MIFRSTFSFLDDDGSCPVYTPCGTSVYSRFVATVTPEGLKKMKVEEVDRYEVIQSFKDGVDLHTILSRYAETQDPSLLFRRAGVYADVRGVPLNVSGAIQAMHEAQKAYNALDPDIRANVTFDRLLSDPNELGRVVQRMAAGRRDADKPAVKSTEGGEQNA